MSNDLLKKKCVPCEGGDLEPFDRAMVANYMGDVEGWTLSDDAKTISKDYKFKDFIGSITFIDRIADVAEEEGHHPDIHIYYNKVHLDLSTHAIGGLSENDFIVAAKVDAVR